MKFALILGACGVAMLLSACNTTPDASNTQVKEKVVACGQGFSHTTNLILADTFDRTTYKGRLSSGFKLQIRPVIFSEIPSGDRLAIYQNYLRCVEEQWDTTQINNFKKKVIAKRKLLHKK